MNETALLGWAEFFFLLTGNQNCTTTLSIMTLSLATLSIMTLSIATLSIMTLGIATLSIMTLSSITLNFMAPDTECCYAQ